MDYHSYKNIKSTISDLTWNQQEPKTPEIHPTNISSDLKQLPASIP
jgi:hypothetical protein